MSEFKIEHDRYDGSRVVDLIEVDSLLCNGDEASFVCAIGDNDELEIIFEAKNGVVEYSSVETAKSLMRAIAELDNKVQESCAAECRRTGFHPRNFEGMLAYIHVFPNRAILHYFGTGVNTEWDEHARFDGVGWSYLGTWNAATGGGS